MNEDLELTDHAKTILRGMYVVWMAKENWIASGKQPDVFEDYCGNFNEELLNSLDYLMKEIFQNTGKPNWGKQE